MVERSLFCDEAGKEDEFLVLGGIIIPTEEAGSMDARIEAWRKRRGLRGEISWKKTTPDRLERYKEFAKGAIAHASKGNLAFRCTVFDRADNKLFPGVKKVDAYGKRLHQFLLHSFGLSLRESDRLSIYPDHEFLPCPPNQLRLMLNCGIAKRRDWMSCDIIREVLPTHSHRSHFIQMADILSGAVAAYNNQDFDPLSHRGSAKKSLIDYIADKAGELDFSQSTPGRSDFSVWHFKPSIKK